MLQFSIQTWRSRAAAAAGSVQSSLEHRPEVERLGSGHRGSNQPHNCLEVGCGGHLRLQVQPTFALLHRSCTRTSLVH